METDAFMFDWNSLFDSPLKIHFLETSPAISNVIYTCFPDSLLWLSQFPP